LLKQRSKRARFPGEEDICSSAQIQPVFALEEGDSKKPDISIFK
jgi:hypothetical protein